ncbi:rhodanese-related sulfurtransferase [Candidatus Gracilibacteria bacterium]|nr:rhodanese-related sulfurtransferase [Candidatus Gracilibacteria bacterium]
MKYIAEYRLLTFYKFVDVENPKEECLEHLTFTNDIGMKGRIYIGEEGISSTVTGNLGQIKAYKLYLQNHPLWKDIPDIDVKSSKVDGHQFPRMQVKVRDEIVVLGKKYNKKQVEEAGNRMNIEEFKDLLDNKNPEDYVVLDMRNNHEYKLGHFKNAIRANTLNFRDLEENIEQYKKEFGDKMVITYCTGGIRCEKSTVMLQEAGLKNTYQLDGGVVKYINTYNDGNWEGNLYVFDDRVSQTVGDKSTHTTIGECVLSGKQTDNCENCRNSSCNARLIVDREEYISHAGFCSKECADMALETLIIKTDTSFDKVQYKKEKGVAKRYPKLAPDIEAKLRKHLSNILEGVNFKHKTSQKEDFVID